MATIDRMLAAARMLNEAVEAGLMVWPEGDQLVIKGPSAAESLVRQLLQSKDDLLPLLKDGRFAIEICSGDECGGRLLVIDGEAYCRRHGMSVHFVERPQ